MDTRNAQIAPGWTVVGSDGAKIGEVSETREDHIVVTGGTLVKHDLYIPVDHLGQASDGTVAVNIPADEVDEEGWRYPPNAGFDHERPAYPEVPSTTIIQGAGYSAGRLAAPEAKGAVLDDGMLEPDEVPNADITPDEPAPDELDEDARTNR